MVERRALDSVVETWSATASLSVSCEMVDGYTLLALQHTPGLVVLDRMGHDVNTARVSEKSLLFRSLAP